MDEYQNLQSHLTIEEFDNKYIDIDRITKEKTIYNIYNNSIKEPYHNFWFLADHCKFLKTYENKKNIYSLVFSFNSKYEKHKNILSTITKILEHVKNICKSKYVNIDYISP